VEFLGWVDDATLRDLYRGAPSLIYPQKRISASRRWKRRPAGGQWWRWGGRRARNGRRGRQGRFLANPPARPCSTRRNLSTPRLRAARIAAQALRFRRERFLERLARAIEQTLAGRM
jgi:hypothetical protein